MIASLWGTVEAMASDHGDCQMLSVRVADDLRTVRCFPSLVGRVDIGARVQINTWAVELALGTGGCDYVVAVDADREGRDPAGHIMKLRYTPLQHPVLAAEAPESPHHAALTQCTSLGDLPVVCTGLHSQVAAVAAAAKWETGGTARVVYVMTDEAALPIALSDTVRGLKAQGLIDATVTTGQAFGGDYEAVNLYSGLIVARAVAAADVIIVGQGPGNVGTATPLGFSGIDQGAALNAVCALDGTAIAVARLSFADPRPRHVGLSHHTRTVLSKVVLRPVIVPLPRLPQDLSAQLRRAVEAAGLLGSHEFITVDAERGLQALESTGLGVTTMGRSIEMERPFFLAAAAAGLVAGQWHTCAAERWDGLGQNGGGN